MGSLKHVSQLFVGTDHRITKSHCFLCHTPMTPNKEVRGNCCHVCDQNAKKVSKYEMTPEDSDFMLLRRMRDLEVEEWNIDGVDYYKHPNGTLCKK